MNGLGDQVNIFCVFQEEVTQSSAFIHSQPGANYLKDSFLWLTQIDFHRISGRHYHTVPYTVPYKVPCNI